MSLHVAAIELTGQVGPGTIITAIASIAAAWIGNRNRKDIKEVKETAHEVNASVNNVAPGEPTLAEKVTEIKENQAEVKRTLERQDNGT